MSIPEVHVAVAVIENENYEVLIALRHKAAHQGGLWEFPGGKIEPDETILQALQREIKEEVGLHVQSAQPFKIIKYTYSDKKVILNIWRVNDYTGVAEGREGQSIKWQSILLLNEEDFPVANKSIIQSLKLPDCYLITGAFKDGKDFLMRLEKSLKQGVRLVQMRCKSLPSDEYKVLAIKAKQLCDSYNAILLLNTDVETYNSIQTTGLHINSQLLKEYDQRPIEDEQILSVSCHTTEDIQKSLSLKADILLLSPVKETKSHPGVAGIGWQKFTEMITNVDVPVYALGGMSADDVVQAKSAGGQGVAAISSFWATID